MNNPSGLARDSRVRRLPDDLIVNHRTVYPADPEWPSVLDELGPDRPRALNMSGQPFEPDHLAVAVVGSRRPTAVGMEMAELFGASLAEAGFVVVSGLATGIDAIAHKAALSAGGKTVAVVGAGLDVSYPQRNQSLRRMIDIRGTVISEYDPGTPPMAHHFPARNRIVAGISTAVLVIEGSEKSGALITARYGLDYNRQVFAVPGSPWNPMAAAPNLLIRLSKAALVTEPQHVFEELAPKIAWAAQDGAPQAQHANVLQLEDDDALVLHVLSDRPLNTDRVARSAGLPINRAALALSRLAVRGFAHRSPVGHRSTAAGARVLAAIEAGRGCD